MGTQVVSAALLAAEGLERRRDGRVVVSLDRLDLERGQVLALLGPNGAGKSTLLRLLLGLERADAGELRLDGRPVRYADAELRRRSAATLQRPALFAGSVLSNAAYGLRARGVAGDDARERGRRALESMGVAHLAEADARRLSGGETQRVAVARALAVRPDILGLDEPTAGLDVNAQREFRERLEGTMREMAGATLLVTHDPADAFALADSIVVIESGRVTQRGDAHELIANPATPFVAAFTGAELLIDGIVTGASEGMLDVRLPSNAVLSVVAGDAAAKLSAGATVHVAYRPEDVLLVARGSDDVTSARNRLCTRVAGITPVGGLLRVRLEGAAPLVALVTRAAALDLALAPGVELTALVKATALRAYPASAGRA